jgi:hypothetical protein
MVSLSALDREDRIPIMNQEIGSGGRQESLPEIVAGTEDQRHCRKQGWHVLA